MIRLLQYVETVCVCGPLQHPIKKLQVHDVRFQWCLRLLTDLSSSNVIAIED